MNIDFLSIYKNLDFLKESLRLQYSNTIYSFLLANKNVTISLEEICKRIKKDEPIEYILGKAKFYNRYFNVNTNTLIPRIETEEIITHTLNIIKKTKSKELIIYDIGTGSGCIIISIALEIVDQKINTDTTFLYRAIENSSEAIKVAQENAENFGIQHVEFIKMPFQEYNFSTHSDYIVCANLPYIPNNEALQKSVFDYEPHVALFGGNNGDELNNELKRILQNSNKKPISLIMEGFNGKIEVYNY